MSGGGNSGSGGGNSGGGGGEGPVSCNLYCAILSYTLGMSFTNLLNSSTERVTPILLALISPFLFT